MQTRRILQAAPLIVALCTYASVAAAQEQSFLRGSRQGWWFYKEEPDPEPPAEVEPEPPPAQKSPPPVPPPAPPPAPAPAPAGPQPFSVDWMQENLEKLRKQAIDNPTRENVLAYLYTQRIAFDKASDYALATQRYVMGDPLIDETARRPTATFAATALNEAASGHQDQMLRKVAKETGIMFFFLSTCEFCKQMAPIVASLAQNYGFNVLPVSVDGLPMPNSPFSEYAVNAGQAEALGVTSVPALFLMRPPNDVQPLAQGVLALNALRDRIAMASLNAGWISEDEFKATQPVNPTPSLAGAVRSAAQEVSAQDLQDPARLVAYIRSKVRM